MKTQEGSSGFTLLEMLLVLAVISLIAVSGLSAYQQKVTSFKVEKTALQMQSLLEAALYYNADHASSTPAWPSSNADLANYLPNNPLNSCPWYNTATQCYTLVPPATPTARNFAVKVTIPTTQPNANQLAQMIATRLPNAAVTNNVVTAYEPTPPTPPIPAGNIVVSINPFVSTNPITGLKGCPAGTSHFLYLSLSGITNPGWDGGGGAWATETSYEGIYNNPDTTAGPLPYNNKVSLANNITSYTPNIWWLDGRNPGAGPNKSPYSNGIAIETCEPVLNNDKKDNNNTPPIQF